MEKTMGTAFFLFCCIAVSTAFSTVPQQARMCRLPTASTAAAATIPSYLSKEFRKTSQSMKSVIFSPETYSRSPQMRFQSVYAADTVIAGC